MTATDAIPLHFPNHDVILHVHTLTIDPPTAAGATHQHPRHTLMAFVAIPATMLHGAGVVIDEDAVIGLQLMVNLVGEAHKDRK